MTAQEVRTLRAISFRIASASPKELLVVIPHVAKQLADCRKLLSAVLAGKESQDGVIVHKFKTQIATLLNAKTSEGRWAGIILAKAAVDFGGFETLSKSGPWVRTILTHLNKPDPPSTKKLAIITLTRLFDLTNGYTNLIREITTPGVQAFVTACLSLVAPKATSEAAQLQNAQYELLPTVLSSFAHLLPSHPTIFRSHLSQIQNLLSILLDSGSSSLEPQSTMAAAQNLFTLLHFSAPKSSNSSPSDAYLKTFNSLLSTTHTTTSLIYRSIIEDWSPIKGSSIPQITVPMDVDLSSSSIADELGLPTWSGIYPGCSRLRSLLALLQTFINSQTSSQVKIPLGAISDLLLRINSVTVPLPPVSRSGKNKGRLQSADSSVRPNDQISQSERDTLFTELPSVHATAVSVISAICLRFGRAVKPLHLIFLEQILWIFDREKFNAELKRACYRAVSLIIQSSGVGMKRDAVRACIPALEACCADVFPNALSASSTPHPGTKSELNADALTTTSTPTSTTTSTKYINTPLTASASHLLTTALAHLPTQHLPHTLRATLDRTAILSQNKDAMLASTLNPSAVSGSKAPPPSLLPFLARADIGGLAVEGLIRPRVPVLRRAAVEEDAVADDDEHEGSLQAEGDNVDESEEYALDRDAEMNGADTAELPAAVDKAAVTPNPFSMPAVAAGTAQQYRGMRKRSPTPPPADMAVKKQKTTHQSLASLHAESASETASVAVSSIRDGETLSPTATGASSTVALPRVDDSDQDDDGLARYSIDAASAEMNGGVVADQEPEMGMGDVEEDSSDDDDGFVVPPLVLKGSSDEDSDGED